MPIITKDEQLKKADKIDEDKTRADTYRWWEKKRGKKLVLLEVAFKLDASDEEACLEAEITPDQLYYYQRKIDQTFQAKKAQWKKYPTLLARKTVVIGLAKDPYLALKYLERKKKDEFSLRQELAGVKDQPLVDFNDPRILKTLIRTAEDIVNNVTISDTTPPNPTEIS